jgi:WD40 repeat protein
LLEFGECKRKIKISLFVSSDSIDCVSLINEETFISGSNDGSLGIWNINKKKPVSTVKEAHKKGSNGDATGWISAVASYHNSDLLASGWWTHKNLEKKTL